MPHVIAWCGFLGAWLLVAGPLDQAVREIEDQAFQHEALDEAKAVVEVVGMLALCISLTVGRTRRRHSRPAVEG